MDIYKNAILMDLMIKDQKMHDIKIRLKEINELHGIVSKYRNIHLTNNTYTSSIMFKYLTYVSLLTALENEYNNKLDNIKRINII